MDVKQVTSTLQLGPMDGASEAESSLSIYRDEPNSHYTSLRGMRSQGTNISLPMPCTVFESNFVLSSMYMYEEIYIVHIYIILCHIYHIYTEHLTDRNKH